MHDVERVVRKGESESVAYEELNVQDAAGFRLCPGFLEGLYCGFNVDSCEVPLGCEPSKIAGDAPWAAARVKNVHMWFDLILEVRCRIVYSALLE